MAIVIKPITVEVSKPNVFQAIAAKQNDSNSRFLKATFVNEGEQINVIPSAKVTINAERNDGESNSFFGEVNNDGTVTVPVHSWILELPGIVNCDISIIEGDSKLTSTTFTLLVEEASHTSEDISTDEQYDVLGELIKEVEGLDVVEVSRKCNELATDVKSIKEQLLYKAGIDEVGELWSGLGAAYDRIDVVERKIGNLTSAIPNTKSGTAIAITDISPIEHTLKIKATSDTVDVSTAKVMKRNAQLFNIATISQNTRLTTGSGVAGSNSQFNASDYIYIPSGATFTGNYIQSCAFYDANKHYVSDIGDKSSAVQRTLTMPINACYMRFDYKKANVNESVMQVQIGEKLTEFEPYKEPTTHDINADGTVDNVTSLYPTTTLIPDTEGVVLDVEYKADTKKYIDNKFAELAALIVNS